MSKTDSNGKKTDETRIGTSHDLSPGDTFKHKTLLVTCTVETVGDSGHVTATDQRGEEHHFDRDLINCGLSEGFIQRGDSE